MAAKTPVGHDFVTYLWTLGWFLLVQQQHGDEGINTHKASLLSASRERQAGITASRRANILTDPSSTLEGLSNDTGSSFH